MALEELGGGGYDYVQDTQPSGPKIGETWLDTSVQPNGQSKIYADLGSGAQWHVLPAEAELTTGRIRELLLLLQDTAVPEVVDPMNLQSGLSMGYKTDVNDDVIIGDERNSGYVTDQFAAPTSPPADFKQWNAIKAEGVTTGGSTSTNPVEFGLIDGQVSRPADSTSALYSNKRGVVINPNTDIENLRVTVSENTSGASTAYVRETDGTTIQSTAISGEVAEFTGLPLQDGTDYYVQLDAGGSGWTVGYSNTPSFPQTGGAFDMTAGVYGTTEISGSAYAISTITSTKNGAHIPASEIADSAFTMRDRVYSEDAGSDGQADFAIPTTGAGGHFGIPILTVVSVKKNGSLIDSANWEYDDVDTVTIDTSAVTVNSGDTIDIKYDFDVFDSTLQPRAYLSRESTSETSPSISHFRYEYLV